ncbi:AAA family ATPase [Candidatus Dependentiae bacterium]
MKKKSLLSLTLVGCLLASNAYPISLNPLSWGRKRKPLYKKVIAKLLKLPFKSVKWTYKRWKKFKKYSPVVAGFSATVFATFLYKKGGDICDWTWDKTGGKIFGTEESKEVDKLMKKLKPKKIPTERFEDLIGEIKNKRTVNTIIERNKNPKFFKGIKEKKHILFKGPPGTGKSSLCRALTNKLSQMGKQISYFDVTGGADIKNPYVSVSEKSIKRLFKTVRSASKMSLWKKMCNLTFRMWNATLGKILKRKKELIKNNKLSVLFLDEIDGLAPKRNSMSPHHQNSNLSVLLTEVESNNPENKNCNFLVFACTNKTELIDEAMTRPGRFSVVDVGLPDSPDERQEFLNKFIQKLETQENDKVYFNDDAKNYALDVLSKDVGTKDFSQADLEAIINEAAEINRLKLSLSFRDRAIPQNDELKEIRSNSLVSIEDLKEAYIIILEGKGKRPEDIQLVLENLRQEETQQENNNNNSNNSNSEQITIPKKPKPNTNTKTKQPTIVIKDGKNVLKKIQEKKTKKPKVTPNPKLPKVPKITGNKKDSKKVDSAPKFTDNKKNKKTDTNKK